MKKVLMIFIALMAFVKLLGPMRSDTSNYLLVTINLGAERGKMVILPDAQYGFDDNWVVDRGYYKSPVKLSFYIYSDYDGSISLSEVEQLQESGASKEARWKSLEFIENDRPNGEDGYVHPDVKFGAPIHVRLKVEFCDPQSQCQKELLEAVVSFKETPVEFGFSVVWAFLSV